MRATELGMAMHPGSDMPPAYLPYCALWPVSGLTSLDLPPSHDCSQWHDDKPALDDRCGGSSGIVRLEKPPAQRTCFPFNLTV